MKFQPRILPLLLAIPIAIGLNGCAVSVPESGKASPNPETYEVVFSASLAGGDDDAQAQIRIGNGADRFRELGFRFDPARFRQFSADGELDVDDGELTWRPPRDGGTLQFEVTVTRQRDNGAYRALVTDNWALFRADDLFPPMRARTVSGAISDSRLELELPDDWSAVTPYRSGTSEFSFPVVNDDRDFDRPTGWVVVGDVGVRRGRIGNTRVNIASPVGEGMRRMDIMAFLNWTLPTLESVFPTMDPRVVIVGAGDPMWRGGLSGPGSLYVHTDRPLISENGTSTFLHELVHVAMGVSGSEHDDWIVEGFAEYYSIRILRETNTLSERRFDLALQMLSDWGRDVDDLFVDRSSGPVTARATIVLYELDTWLRETSGGRVNLDDVVLALNDAGGTYDYPSLCRSALAVAKRSAEPLLPENLPGAPSIADCR